MTSLRQLWEHIPQGFKQFSDLVSVTTLLGSLVGMLPAVASVLTIMWTVIRIYETETVRGLVNKWKARG